MTTYLVQGKEPTLRDREVQRLIEELLEGADRSLALDDHTIPGRRRANDDESDGDEADVEVPVFMAINNALSSPPFMTPARVVVVRDIDGLVTDQVKWLASWMADPLPDVHLVLVAGSGRTPAALDKAAKSHAEVVGAASEKTDEVLRSELKEAPVTLSRDAVARVASHFGEDAGRVPELVELLHSAYGDDAALDVSDVEQYLGEVGTVGRFDLGNAIDKGDVGQALAVLHRQVTATSGKQVKPLHPMQIMATLAYHYQDLLRLDDPDIRTSAQAAQALGKSEGFARFRLQASRKLGTDGLREAMRLLADAELDLRGASGLDERTVIDVLVARLAALSRRTARAR